MKTEVEHETGITGVNVALDGDRVLVRCPYNTRFISGAKKLAGKWVPNDKLWAFSNRHQDLVRDLCRKWFGTDGTTVPDLVDVQITFPAGRSVDAGPVAVFGRVVARASGRGSTVRLGTGVVLVEGSAFIQSNYKGWRTIVSEGSIARMQGVPRPLITSELPMGVKVSIIERLATTDEVSRLRAERTQLISRLEAIDAALAAHCMQPATTTAATQ